MPANEMLVINCMWIRTGKNTVLYFGPVKLAFWQTGLHGVSTSSLSVILDPKAAKQFNPFSASVRHSAGAVKIQNFHFYLVSSQPLEVSK